MSSECASNCSSSLSGSLGQVFMSSVNLLFASQYLLTEDWPEDSPLKEDENTFNYIIVGAGSAGSVLASRLTEDKRIKVLLIEAGGDPPFESLVPAGAYNLPGTNIDWKYKTENDFLSCQGVKDGECLWPRGKVLGGSSSINGMLYIRGDPRNYDNFYKAGNIGWDYKTALKYFKKTENLTDPIIENDPYLRKYHGFNGLLGISTFDSNNPLQKYIKFGFEELGYKTIKDINGPPIRGIVNPQVTVQDGKRESTARAYLVPARDRKNLVIFKNTFALKIIFQGKDATGVLIRLPSGKELIVNATNEVIVSAGVINTPQLLMLSGVGPKDHLQKFQIPIVADLAVGQNLHEHVNVPIFLTVATGTPDRSNLQVAFDVAEYISLQRGYYAQQGFSQSPYLPLCLLTKVKSRFSDSNVTNLFIYGINYGVNSTGLNGFCSFGLNFKSEICASVASYNVDNQILALVPEIFDVKSRGNVSLASADPMVYPKIYPNFLSEDEDVELLLNSIDIISKLQHTEAFKKINAKINKIDIDACKEYEFPQREYWKCYIHQLTTPGYHPLGTAKMGPKEDPNAVVGPNLLVHGLKRLRIVDGSVIPGTISGNTNAAIIMFAERASDLIKADFCKNS